MMLAAGLILAAGGVAGLLLTRHPASLIAHPLAEHAAALPAPAGPIAAVPPAAGHLPARPTELTIPVIAVRTRLVYLGLTSSGALQVPAATSVAGWYTGSSRPGAVGPAVIVGHIDSYTGPGIFYRLADLHAGDRIYLRRSDGTLVVFRVTAVRVYPKDRFPTQSVYGPTPDPELRLITCGGTFDPFRHSYLSNVVVYAAA